VEALIAKYRGLVTELAVVYAPRKSDLFDELVSVGLLALWKAIQHYDPDRGVHFAAYARQVIHHQMQHAANIYRRGCIRASVRKIQILRRAQEFLTQSLLREQQSWELADHLGWPEAEVVRLLGEQATMTSLETGGLIEEGEENGRELEIADASSPTEDEIIDSIAPDLEFLQGLPPRSDGYSPVFAEYLREVLPPAKIADVARYCGLSRKSVKRWMEGQFQPEFLEDLLVLSYVTGRELEEFIMRWRRRRA